MNRRIEVAILAVGLLGIAGFVLLSWRPVIAAIERPAPESSLPSPLRTEKLLPPPDIVRPATRVPADRLTLADTE